MSCECDDTGYLIDQGYRYADIPEGWVPVQSCDLCQVLTDSAAAEAAARDLGTEWDYFNSPTELIGDEFLVAGPGDFAVRLP